MPNHQTAERSKADERDGGRTARTAAKGADKGEYPVREYIGSMAQELADMTRWDGDEELGRLLDAAADHAGVERRPDARIEPRAA